MVAGDRAKYKGSGTVNGKTGFQFMLTAVDGKNTAADTFRIKIWTVENGQEVVVYDNQMGATNDSYAGTTLGGGSIQIHS